MFAGLKTIVVDELHAFAKEKRGDLLALSIARLQALAPGLRRVGLSATISDPDAYRGWLAPDARHRDWSTLVHRRSGRRAGPVDPDPRRTASPGPAIPGRHAAREVMELIERHKTTLVFCNTRSLAELIFQDLWAVNDQALPIGIHHGSLALEARRKVEAAMAPGKLRGLVAHRQPRPRHRLGRHRPGRPDGRAQGQFAPAAAHRPRQPPARRAEQGHRSSPATASNISKPAPRSTRSTTASSTPRSSAPGTLDVLAQHILAVACAGAVRRRRELLAEVRSAAPYAGARRRDVRRRCSASSPPAAMRSRPMTSSAGWSARADGRWRIAKPAIAPQHRLNAGVIVEQPLLDRPLPQRPQARHGRGRLRLDAHARRPFLLLPASASRSSSSRTATSSSAPRRSRRGSSPTAGSACRMSTHLANRVRHMLADRNDWHRFPDDVREWLEVQERALAHPRARATAGRDLPARAAALHGRLQLRRLERAPVAGHADHPADGERGPQAARLRRQRLRPRLLRAGADPRPQGAVLARHPRARIRRLGRAIAICSRPRSAKWR